jgi:hypothetical protein
MIVCLRCSPHAISTHNKQGLAIKKALQHEDFVKEVK